MAEINDQLFSNPTNRDAVDSLNQAQRDMMDLTAKPPKTMDDIRSLMAPQRGMFGQEQPSQMLSGLADIAAQFPNDAPLAPEGQNHNLSADTDSFTDSFGEAFSQGWADVHFGASLITGDDDTNMMSLEQKFQRMKDGLDIPPEKWTPEAETFSEGLGQMFTGKHRFFDSDYWGNFAGGTAPSIMTMLAGAGLGAGGGALVGGVGAVPGAIGGGVVGSGSGVALQTLGSTMTEAYKAYREQGKSVKEAFQMARSVANVDAMKSGAIASIATLIAPARVVAGSAGSMVPRLTYAAPAGGTTAKTLGAQFLQQSLVIQPSLEVSDVVSSNSIAANSFDPNRTLTQGSIDAFVGSVFFDLPTTAGGVAVQYAKRRRPLGEDRQIEYKPAFDDPEVETEAPPEASPTLALPDYTPRFNPVQQEDGSWTIVDKDEVPGQKSAFIAPETYQMLTAQLSNLAKALEVELGKKKPDPKKIDALRQRIETTLDQREGKVQPVDTATDPELIFDTEAQAQEAADSRNEFAESSWKSPYFPDSKSGRAQFVQEQIERITALDARNRERQQTYTGSEKVNTAIGFFRYLGEADSIIAEIDSLPVEQRNTAQNQALYADAKERLALLKMIMDPVQNVMIPQFIFETKGKFFRVQMENGRPVRPINPKTGAVMPNHITVYDPASKTGVRNVAVTSGDLSDSGVPVPTNMLTTADVYARLKEAKRRYEQTLLQIEDQTDLTAEQAAQTEAAETREADAAQREGFQAKTSEIRDRQDRAEIEEYLRDQAGENETIALDDRSPDAPRTADPAILEEAAAPNEWATAEVDQGPQAEMTEADIKFARQTVVDRVLAFVPEESRSRVRKILEMWADALGPEFNSVRVMDIAEWIAQVRPDTPAGTAAVFHQFVNGMDGKLERIIALSSDRDTTSLLTDFTHELVHLAVQLKKLPEAGMLDWYRQLPSDNYHKAFIENDPVYSQETEAVKAEEAMAMILSEMSTRRYTGRLQNESGFQYLMRQVIRLFNEMYEGFTGTNMVNRFLDNIASYGVDVEAKNPFDTYRYDDIVDDPRLNFDDLDLKNDPRLNFSDLELLNDPRRETVRYSRINDKNPLGGGKIGLVYDAMPEEQAPKKTRRVYKLMKLMGRKGLLFPLYAKARTGPTSRESQGFTIGDWFKAEYQRPVIGQELAPRSGIHSLGNPVFDQGKVLAENETRIWVEAEIPVISKNTQQESDSSPDAGNGQREGIRNRLLRADESYDFKTNESASPAAGTWPISGSFRITKVLGDETVAKVLQDAGLEEFVEASRSNVSDADAAALVQDAETVAEAVRNAEDVTPFEPYVDPQDATLARVRENAQAEVIRYSRIPEDRRATRSKPQGQPQEHSDGRSYKEQDLTATSASINTLNFNVKDLWREVVESYGPSGQLLLDILASKNGGKTVEPRENAFWLRALKLPDRARFWYEISSERFAQIFRSFNDSAFVAKIIDLVAATSVQAGPLDNLLRTVSVLAEHVQDRPVMTDLTDKGQGAGVNKALSEDNLSGDKTGNFAGTMNYLMGLTDTVPLSTNDRQVAVYFNTSGELIAGAPKLGMDADGNKVELPSFYDMISEFHIRLRDRLNAELPIDAEPFETWQLQALGWVQIRAELNAKKGDVSGYDDYDQVIDEVFRRLDKAGVDVSSGELSPSVLRDPKVPYALRDTMRAFVTSPMGTVETITRNTPVGKIYSAVTGIMKDMGGTTTVLKTVDAINKRPINNLARRRAKNPSIVSKLVSVITDKKTDVSRLGVGTGTFQGEANYNLRIPLMALDTEQRGVFLSILGSHLRQSSMAAHQLHQAEPGSTPQPGMKRTFRIFVSNVDRDLVNQNDLAAFSRALGIEMAAQRVANGNVIDILVGNYEGTLSEQTVSAALRKTDLPDKGEIFVYPMDFLSETGDYVQANVDTDQDYDYNQHYENFIKGVKNGTISEIESLDPRITRREARSFVQKDHENLTRAETDSEGKTTRKALPDSVNKRAQRIRAKYRTRITNLRKVEAEAQALFAQQEVEQLQFLEENLAKIWPKLNRKQQEALSQEFPLDPSLDRPDENIEQVIADARENVIRYSRVNSDPNISITRKKRIMNWWARRYLSAVFTGSAKRVRQLAKNTRAGFKLANILDRDQFAYTGVKEHGIIEEDVHGQIEEMSARYSNAYAQILRGLSDAQIKQIPDLMRGKDKYFDQATNRWIVPLKGFPASKAKAMRQLMDMVWADIEKVYADQGMAPPQKLRNYFPQRYKLEGQKHDMETDQAFRYFLASVFADPTDPNGSVENSLASADKILSKIKEEGFQPIWGNDVAPMDPDQDVTRPYQLTPYEMKRMINIDPYTKFDVALPDGRTVKMSLVDFLDNDTGTVLNGYMLNMARRLIFARRFGVNGHFVRNIVDEFQKDAFGKVLVDTDGTPIRGEIDQELIAEGKAPLTAGERKDILNLVRLNMGLAKPLRRGLGDTFGAMKFFGNLTLLSLATIQSLAEPLLIGSRLGLFPMLIGLRTQIHELLRVPVKVARAGYRTMADGPQPTYRDKFKRFREHYGYDQTDVKMFAKDLGIIFENMQYVLQNSVEDVSYVRWDKLNNVFFRSILLQPLTEMQQTAALAASMTSLRSWRKKASGGSQRHLRYLQEVGLTLQDVADFDIDAPMDTANAKVRAALRQMNREIIMAPDAGRKPGWMSDPRFQLISHIKTWIFTFNNTVLQRSWRELGKGNPMPLMYLAGFGLANAMLYEWREWMRYGDEGNPYMNRIGMGKDNPHRLLYVAFERGGLFGPTQYALDVVLGSRIGSDSGIVGTLAPSLNIADRVIMGLATAANIPASENKARTTRKALDHLSRAVPVLNAMGQYRADAVNKISGYTPGKRRKKSKSRYSSSRDYSSSRGK